MLITFSCPECKAEPEVAATAGGSQMPGPQCSKALSVVNAGGLHFQSLQLPQPGKLVQLQIESRRHAGFKQPS